MGATTLPRCSRPYAAAAAFTTIIAVEPAYFQRKMGNQHERSTN
jgi:hypothetical protein